MSLRNQVMDILKEIKPPNLYIPEILELWKLMAAL